MALPYSYFYSLVMILSLLLCITVVHAQPTLLADLTYGSFQGAYSSKYNISYWQKIPFAAPPTGENRFRAPQPPIPIMNGTYDSSQEFDYCPQRTVSVTRCGTVGVATMLTYSDDEANGSEDCLYLSLYSRPWTISQALRPVVVVFFGGGFIEGGGSLKIPPSGYPVLNVSDSNDFIFVYPNYR